MLAINYYTILSCRWPYNITISRLYRRYWCESFRVGYWFYRTVEKFITYLFLLLWCLPSLSKLKLHLWKRARHFDTKFNMYAWVQFNLIGIHNVHRLLCCYDAHIKLINKEDFSQSRIGLGVVCNVMNVGLPLPGVHCIKVLLVKVYSTRPRNDQSSFTPTWTVDRMIIFYMAPSPDWPDYIGLYIYHITEVWKLFSKQQQQQKPITHPEGLYHDI